MELLLWRNTSLSKDCILIQNNKAHEIWKERTLNALPKLHSDLLKNIVEVSSESVSYGDIWNSETESFE